MTLKCLSLSFCVSISKAPNNTLAFQKDRLVNQSKSCNGSCQELKKSLSHQVSGQARKGQQAIGY